MLKAEPVAGLGFSTLDDEPIVPVPVVWPNWPPRVVPAAPRATTFPAITPLVMVTSEASRLLVLGEALLRMNDGSGAVGFPNWFPRTSMISLSELTPVGPLY